MNHYSIETRGLKRTYRKGPEALASVPRAAFVFAAILADALGVFLSSLVIIGIGALLGTPITGSFIYCCQFC